MKEGIFSSQSKIFFWSLICFIFGAGLGNFFTADAFAVFCLFLVLIFVIIVFLGQHKDKLIVSLLLACSVFGFWRYQVSLPDFDSGKKIYHYNDQKIKFIGTVANIDERIDQQKITLAVTGLVASSSNKTKKVSGRVLVGADLFPQYHYGDKLAVVCKLEKPGLIKISSVDKAGQNTASWDYGRYLAKDNIYSLCSYAGVNLLSSGSPYLPLRIIYNLREKFSESLNQTLPEPSASILNGMLLNLTRGIPDTWNNIFSNLGLTHIIAISGSHITIIVSILMILALSLGLVRQKAFWAVSAVVALYIVLIGFPASAVRAAIMGIMVLYAQKNGRLNNMRNALALAAALMLLVNPKILLIDVGFQLSFLSVIGLIYFSPILEKYFSRLPQLGPVKEIFLLTLSAQIMTLPLLVFYFQKFSPLSLLANILILPVIPFLTVWSLAQMFLGTISLAVGRLLAIVSWLIMEYWLQVSKVLSGLPGANIKIAYLNWLFPAVAYPLIFYWLWREKKKQGIIETNKIK